MSIVVNNTDNQLNVLKNGVLDVYNVKTIKSVSRAVDASGVNYIDINFIANDKNNSLRIPLNLVTSPVTWTNDTAGAIAAVEDLRDWLSEVIEVEISEANDSILVYGFDGTNNQPISVSTSGNINDNLHDGIGYAITSSGIGPKRALDVNIAGGVTLEVNLDAANDEVSVYGSNGGTPTAVAVNASGHVAIQDGGNSITVDGTVTANAGTGNFTVVQATASNLNATVVGGTGVQRTPTITRTSANSSVSAGAYSVSFASVGTADATVGGATLKPGETISFDAGAINNTLAAITYNSSAAGAELLIIKLT